MGESPNDASFIICTYRGGGCFVFVLDIVFVVAGFVAVVIVVVHVGLIGL